MTTDSKKTDDFTPFFIVGAPRSGTTLLSVLLDRHSRACVSPESHFFHTVPRHWPLYSGKSHEYILSKALESHLYDFKLDWSVTLSHFKQYKSTFPNAYRSALEVYSKREGKEFIGEKTATHMDHLGQILRWYPHAKFIWILRDGRDVAMGLIRHQWLHSHIRRHCFTWKRITQEGLYWQKVLSSDQFYCVKFEDLLRDNENELRRIDHFLGLDFEQQQLNTEKESKAVLNKEIAHKGRALSNLDSSRIDVWKSTSSEKQQDIMLSSIKHELTLCSYETSSMKYSSWMSCIKNMLFNIPYYTVYRPRIYKGIKLIQYYVNLTGFRFSFLYKNK